MNWAISPDHVWRQSSRTLPVVSGLSWPLLLTMLVTALVVAVCAYIALSRNAALRARERELASAREMLRQSDAALAAAELQMQQLQQGTAPMLQVIHELRAPAASIQTTLDVLLQGYTAASETARDEMLRLARSRAEVMLALVNDLLSLGTAQREAIAGDQGAEPALARQPVQLADILWDVMPQMRIKAMLRGVHLNTHVPDSLPLIQASAEHMRQLLSNLIDNAIKYTYPDGEVTVSLREEGGQVVGEVADTGIGIAEADRSRIFKQFYRAQNAKEVEAYGTGLGLSLVKQVVELHGGRLRLESELGKGSKFTFSFAALRETRGTRRAGAQAELGEDWRVTLMEKEAVL